MNKKSRKMIARANEKVALWQMLQFNTKHPNLRVSMAEAEKITVALLEIIEELEENISSLQHEMTGNDL